MTEKRPRSGAPSANLPSRKALPPFEALRAFDAVARLGGVRKAAQHLGRDHAVVSRHLRMIEAWTGTTLVERTTTGAVLTQDGARYHAEIAAAIDAIANATLDLMKRSDNHRLHIWCMPGFAFYWLIARLGEFESSYPGLEIELRPSNTSPDFSAHEADVDIRFVAAYGKPFQLQPGLRSIEITRTPIVAVASPEYLAAHPEIRTPRDLLSHQLLHEEDFESWTQWLAAHGVHHDTALTGPRLWQVHLTLDAARHGRGIALTNHMVAAEDLSSGRLVEIGRGNPSFSAETMGIYLFIARADRWEAPSLRSYRRWLLSAVSERTRNPA